MVETHDRASIQIISQTNATYLFLYQHNRKQAIHCYFHLIWFYSQRFFTCSTYRFKNCE